MILYYKTFANDVCVDFIGIRCTNIVFLQGGSPDRVVHTHFVIRSDKIPCKVVAIVCCRFKTNDEAVLLEGNRDWKSATGSHHCRSRIETAR